MAPDASQPLILVVDDDPDIRDVLKVLLDDEGYRTVTASDGLEAVEVAHRARPDLIMLDAVMPFMDGPEFCRVYRAEGGTAPVIVMSASTPRRIRATVEACGAVASIDKPFRIEAVLATVARCLAH
jgi:two-component system OmpR family response regulator